MRVRVCTRLTTGEIVKRGQDILDIVVGKRGGALPRERDFKGRVGERTVPVFPLIPRAQDFSRFFGRNC